MNINYRIVIPVVLLLAGFFIYSFTNGNESAEDTQEKSAESAAPVNVESYVPGESFNKYWYAGEAELTSYDLQQARYGEMREGTAVLVFVAEDFSSNQLTKFDGKNGGKIPVLKVNFDKKFVTGIYPYSMILSVASPVDIGKYPHALKISTGVQEWCGHTYTQLNLRGNKYEFTEHSYFPGQGDTERKLDATLTEDELWTRLRIAPDKLPVGNVTLLPGTFYSRMKHFAITPQKANLSMEDAGDGFKTYTIAYADGSHTLKIQFAADFPYVIEGWEDTYMSGKKELTTIAQRKKTIKLDYWARNGNKDLPLRKDLGLD